SPDMVACMVQTCRGRARVPSSHTGLRKWRRTSTLPSPSHPTHNPTEGRPPVRRMIEARNPIGELVTGRQWDQLRDALRPMHPSDIADVIIEQPTVTEGIIFRLLPREKAARAFAYLPPAEQRHLLDSLSNEQVRHLLDEMSPDDRTHLLEEMPAEVTRELLLQLDPQELQAARKLLGYPENTAGRYMTPKYAWIYPDMTA